MRTLGIAALVTTLVTALVVAGPGAASAQEAGEGLTVELNKTEDVEGGCRSYFLFRNRTGLAFAEFEMSLAILDADGVIDRLLTIDAAPLPSGRTTLKLFEVPGIGCGEIGEILLHDIAACRPQNEEPVDCFGFLELMSRTDAPLVK